MTDLKKWLNYKTQEELRKESEERDNKIIEDWRKKIKIIKDCINNRCMGFGNFQANNKECWDCFKKHSCYKKTFKTDKSLADKKIKEFKEIFRP